MKTFIVYLVRGGNHRVEGVARGNDAINYVMKNFNVSVDEIDRTEEVD